MKSLKNSTGGEECGRLVFSSLGPVFFFLLRIGDLQSRPYPLNRSVDLIQDRRHCTPSLDLDLADRFHLILHHLYHLLHLQTSFDLSLSLSHHQVMDL